MARTLLLTGRPGIGKTTIIQHVAQALGARAGGFYTQEIFGPGGRKGFRLITLDGREVVMAHHEFRTRNRVGRYGVDVAALDAVGVAAIRQAVLARDMVVIDEIGKMELFSGEFRGAVLKAISSPKVVIATVMQRQDDWVAALEQMPQVATWEVTFQNRNQMPERVMQWAGDAESLTASVSR